MSSSTPLATRTFPARVAELGFTTVLPQNWICHDLPNEEVDFSNPTRFLPLGIVTAPHAAIVFAFAARPAYEDGTLHDWAWYHLNHNQLQPRAVGRDVIAGVPAVSGEAVQPSEMGPMVVRFAFLEDGNRLLNLTLTAPEMLADSVREAWFAMLRSFTLESPRGSRFPIDEHPDTLAAAAAATAPPQAMSNPNPAESCVPVREQEMKVPDGLKPKKCRFYDFALAANAASLEPDNPFNVNLRDRGAGLVPNVIAVSEPARRARLAAGAILAEIDVPFGWHVIDDGRRTLVFEPGGNIQISLNLIPRQNQSNAAILDAIEAEMRRDYPSPEFVRLRQGQIHALGARNIADGSQPLEQYHLLYPFRDQSMLLRARVTAIPEQASDACNLAELILDSCAFDACQLREDPAPAPEVGPGTSAQRNPEAPAQGLPAWWQETLALEAGNQLDAAERHIRDHCPHIGYAASTAEMYRLRMLRLKQSGDASGAVEAFKKASDFIALYASLATSGGEGAALSLERDQFRARLVAEFGGDPEAV